MCEGEGREMMCVCEGVGEGDDVCVCEGEGREMMCVCV